LFGIGAATGAAVATGTTATAFAAPGPDPSVGAGFSDSDTPRPNLVTPVTVAPGAQVLAVGYSAFQIVSFAQGASLVYASPASVGIAGQAGHVHAAIPLPAGSRVLRVDVVGYRVTAGTQTWNLYKTNLQSNAGLTTVMSVTTNSASAEVQGAMVLATPLVLAPGESLHVELVNASIAENNRAVGALVQYIAAPSGGITPIAPRRVYDSRVGTVGKIVKGATRTVSVATDGTAAVVVPVGARAIAYNLTITDTESDYGYLSIVPGGDPTGGVSSINWDKAKATLANGLIVGVNASREVSVFCDGTGTTKAHFVIDVVGYFL
jgi:hypothetical protein